MPRRDYLEGGSRAPCFGGGGRGAHGPAPASASLHRFRRQTVLRGTVSPPFTSARWRGTNGRLCGVRWRSGKPMPSIRPCPTQYGLGRGGHSHPPAKAPSAWAHVSGATEQSGRSETMALRRSGPPESSARRWARAVSRERQAPPSCWRERDRWSSGGQSAAEP